MTAWFDELPGCLAQAATAEEAVERLWDGLPAYLDMLKEHGHPAPDAIDPPAPVSTSSGTPGVRVTTAFSVGGPQPQFATL
jgi:predicted RNase H-like HicB family nuclease